MFPETGLPLRLDLVRIVPLFDEDDEPVVDDEDNQIHGPKTVIRARKYRRYRNRQLEQPYVRDGRNVTGVLACKYRDGDDFREDDELIVYRLEGEERLDETRVQVVYPQRIDAIRRPSHWEIVVSEVGSGDR